MQYLARKGLVDVSDVEREGGGRKYKGASVRNSEGCGGTVEVNCNERLHDRGRKMDEEESRMYVGERERKNMRMRVKIRELAVNYNGIPTFIYYSRSISIKTKKKKKKKEDNNLGTIIN